MAQGPKWVFDLTVGVTVSAVQWEESWEAQKNRLIVLFNEIAKRWVFQLEKGSETGYYHFQCRVSLIQKSRDNSLAKLMHEHGFPNTNVSLTSNKTVKGSKVFDYVTKSETRLSGPWRDDADSVSFTSDVKKMMKAGLFLWQIEIEKDLQQLRDREVDILYDLTGNQGKSVFSRYMCQRHKAVLLPPIKNSTMLSQTAASAQIAYQNDMKGQIKIFIIDLPRAMNQENMASVYECIEQIKSGNLWETRYKLTHFMIDPPRVFVMTNTLPDFNFLSSDRWNLWTVNEHKEIFCHGRNRHAAERSAKAALAASQSSSTFEVKKGPSIVYEKEEEKSEPVKEQLQLVPQLPKPVIESNVSTKYVPQIPKFVPSKPWL